MGLSEGRRRPLLDAEGKAASSEWSSVLFSSRFFKWKHLFSCILSCHMRKCESAPIRSKPSVWFSMLFTLSSISRIKDSRTINLSACGAPATSENLTLVPVNIPGHMTDQAELDQT